MAETFSTIDFELNQDHINYAALPDVQSRIDILGSSYRDGDFALKHGKVSISFTATYQAFSDTAGDTAKAKYENLLALQATIDTLTTWQGTYTNVLLENVGSPVYTKTIIAGESRDMAMIPITFRKMQ